MRWDHVHLFLAVARGGSLSAAARSLRVHHATVHRHLGELEEDLGARLVDRRPDGLVLTPAGEAMLPLAEAMEAQALVLERTLRGADQQPRGEVRLTAPESLLPLLTPALAELRARWPEIEVCGRFTDQALDLARGEADVAVRPTHQPPLDVLGRRVAGVAWAAYRPTAVQVPLPWVVYGDDLARLPATAWWRARHGEERVEMTVNTVPAAAALIRAGVCRGLLPCFVGDADPALEREGAPIPEAQSALWVLSPLDLRRTTRVRLVVEQLVETLSAARPLLEGES